MFGIAGGTPGSFLKGGGDVAGANVFVNKAGVEAVAAGGGVERGDFFGWALVELSASRGVGGVGAAGDYDDVVEFAAFTGNGLFERLAGKFWEGGAEFFFIDFNDIRN